MLSENGCSDNQFLTGFFQAPVPIFTAYQNKKGNKKVVFTGRLQGGVCSLYSIGGYVQCIHSLLYVLDNVTNTRRQRLRHIGPLPTLCTYVQPWGSTAHGLRSFRTCTTTTQQINASRRPLRAMQTVLCKRPLTTYNLYQERDCCTIHIIGKATDVFSSHDCIFHVEQVPTD